MREALMEKATLKAIFQGQQNPNIFGFSETSFAINWRCRIIQKKM